MYWLFRDIILTIIVALMFRRFYNHSFDDQRFFFTWLYWFLSRWSPNWQRRWNLLNWWFRRNDRKFTWRGLQKDFNVYRFLAWCIGDLNFRIVIRRGICNILSNSCGLLLPLQTIFMDELLLLWQLTPTIFTASTSFCNIWNDFIKVLSELLLTLTSVFLSFLHEIDALEIDYLRQIRLAIRVLTFECKLLVDLKFVIEHLSDPLLKLCLFLCVLLLEHSWSC